MLRTSAERAYLVFKISKHSCRISRSYFVLGFAPFSFYSIIGSSAKKQRSDEQPAVADVAAKSALEQNVPAPAPP